MTIHRLAIALFFAVLSVFALPVSAQTAEGVPAAKTGDLPPSVAKELADILKDDAARAALISQLERASESEEATASDANMAPQDAQPTQSISIGRQFAEITKSFAERAMETLTLARQQVSRTPNVFAALSGAEFGVMVDAFQSLALVILVTITVLFVLRFWAKRLYRSIGETTHDAGVVRTAAMLVVTTIMDAGVVLLAWAAGYVVTLTLLGEMGQIGIRQTLYLNAFLLVEMTRVVMRAVLSPTTGELRFISVSDRAAKLMSRTFGAMAMVIGYGQLLLVPIINQQVSFAAGRGVSTLVALITILIAAGLVIYSRRALAAWMMGEDPEDRPGIVRWAARNWHIPALIYLAGLLAIVISRPDGVIWPVMAGSGKVALAIIAGAVAAGFITRSIARGVRMPLSVNQRLPLLERRLNAFVPRALFVLRLVIIFVVVGFSLNTLGIVDLTAWMEGQFGVQFTATLVSVAFIILVSFAIWLAFTSWVDYRLNPEFGSAPTAREKTLLSLLKNAATIVLMVITLMFVLSEIGLDIAPLIASAGVLGLAIGFGSQKLVQDIITGVFIQFENAMNVGDVVTLGGTTGTVERLTIRSVSLRDVQGAFHIIPFSSVDMVSNYMREYGFFVCDMGVGYREDVGMVKQAMHDAFDELYADDATAAKIMEPLQWMGLQSLADSAVILRARIKCTPGNQWGVGRQYNEICKRIFDERNIEIPFPHQTIYFGEDRDGKAPSAPIRIEGKPAET